MGGWQTPNLYSRTVVKQMVSSPVWTVTIPAWACSRDGGKVPAGQGRAWRRVTFPAFACVTLVMSQWSELITGPSPVSRAGETGSLGGEAGEGCGHFLTIWLLGTVTPFPPHDKRGRPHAQACGSLTRLGAGLAIAIAWSPTGLDGTGCSRTAPWDQQLLMQTPLNLRDELGAQHTGHGDGTGTE